MFDENIVNVKEDFVYELIKTSYQNSASDREPTQILNIMLIVSTI